MPVEMTKYKNPLRTTERPKSGTQTITKHGKKYTKVVRKK